MKFKNYILSKFTNQKGKKDNEICHERKQYNKPSLTVEELSAALLETNEKLRDTNEKLLSAERSRSEMFANISHDLRSPITAIHSSIEYLSSLTTIERSELDPLLRLMNTRIISLENLINDLFLLTTLDNKAIDLKFTSIEFGMFLEDYFFSYEADSKYAERELKLEVPENFPVPVSIDIEKMTRVLDNLFTNSLKYSSSGDSITLGSYQKDNNVYVFVKDTGIGIPQNKVSRIFESSYTISTSRTPGSSSGCGLGLSIVDTIIKRHEGRIWCESQLGKGSTFTFSLPIQNKL